MTKDIPKAARLACCVFEDNKTLGKEELFAWGVVQLVDYKSELLSGPLQMPLWQSDTLNVHHAPIPNPDQTLMLFLELPRCPIPVVFPTITEAFHIPKSVLNAAPSPEESASLKTILEGDQLYELEATQKMLVWKMRYYLKQFPASLRFVLQSTRWNQAEEVARLQLLLQSWPPLQPYDALNLLDVQFMDERVRSFAVQCLEGLDNSQVAELMLQFIQVLKYEPQHESSLARFLLHRSLADKGTIGHLFFWYLRGEVLTPRYAERFSLLAETYLRCCEDHRGELVKQVEMVSK